MCLLFAAWRCQPGYRLILAANRDEFHYRRTAPVGPWPQAPDIIGGRDLEAGGSWLAAARGGRVAAVTNYRDLGPRLGARSRGLLVSDFVKGTASAHGFARRLMSEADLYDGFNLLISDEGSLVYCSNRDSRGLRALPPGLYGLSNGVLDSPWPKVTKGKKAFGDILSEVGPDSDRLLAMLADTAVADDEELPDTGLDRQWERMLSPRFIVSPQYGTRSSSILTVDDQGHVVLVERRFDADGQALETRTLELAAAGPEGPAAGDDA